MVLESLLIINEDKPSRTMLRYLLEIEGYVVQESENINDAYMILGRNKIEMILLDASWDEAVIEGFLGQIASGIYGDRLHIVLLIPEETSLEKAVFCKQLPVSHQIERPFTPRELVAMIRRCFNNPAARQEASGISSIDLQFNDATTSFSIDGQTIKLAKIEFDLLRFFLLSPNKIYSRKALLREIWGTESGIEERTVDVHIRRLRRALKSCSLDKQVQTVHGAGYRFAEAFVTV